MSVSVGEQQKAGSAHGQKTMKRVVVDHFGGPEVLKVVEDDDPRPGPGEVRVRVLAAGVSFTDAQLRAGTYLGVPEAAVHARLRARRRRRGARPGLLEAASGRPHRRADGVGRRRGARLRAGGVRGRGARGPRPGGGREPRLPVHDRLPDASPHGEGEARGDGARARRGRQGGHRGARARSAGRASPLRDLLRLATAPRSSGSARWRSTTATRTSWLGCAS